MSVDPSVPPSSVAPRRLVAAGVIRLGQESGDDLCDALSPAARIELVAVLSRRMWELTGRPFPRYTRAAMPVRIVRRASDRVENVEALGEDPDAKG